MARIDPATLPNRVRYWRELAGLTLRDLAKDLGLAHGSLHRIETGAQELSQYWMERIGARLEVAPADLLLPQLGGLSPEERRIIDTYRQLPEVNRQLILSVIEGQQAYRLPTPAGDPVALPLPPQAA